MHDEITDTGLTLRNLWGALCYLVGMAGSSVCLGWLVTQSQPAALAPAHLVRQAPACVRQRLAQRFRQDPVTTNQALLVAYQKCQAIPLGY